MLQLTIFGLIAMSPVLWVHPQDSPAAPQPEPASQPAAARPATGFIYKTVPFEGRAFPYTVYVPPEYTAETAWPVILFLHGSGERGGDGFLQTDVGIARAIRRNRRLCPAIVVMPQCPANTYWSESLQNMALLCVQETSRAYHLDGTRVYLTGLSLGGAGVWELGARFAGRFAAVAPISGFVSAPNAPPDEQRVSKLARRLTGVPIWCFHGAADQAVSVVHSRVMVAAIRAAGGAIRYTEYPSGPHTIWDRVYQDRAFWRWLLAQRRAEQDAGASAP